MTKTNCVAACVLIICVCIVCCVWAKNDNDTGCCGKCDCAKAWATQAEINVKAIEHLRRNGVVIGAPAPVGSAK